MKDFADMNLPDRVNWLWKRNNGLLKECFVWEKFSFRRVLVWPLSLLLVLLIYGMIISGVLFFSAVAALALPFFILYNIFKKPAVK